MDEPIYVGGTTKIKVLVRKGSSAANLSTFDVREFFFVKPSGAQTTVNAAFSNGTGTDGYLEYQPNTAFYDEHGMWTLQPRVKRTADTARLPCRPITFHVAPNIHAAVSA